MTRKLAGGITAVALVIGVLIGASGTIVLRDATVPETDLAAVMTEHMNGQGMAGMMSMMGGSMMGGPSDSTGPGMMGPNASAMPGRLHDLHHASPAPDVSK
jgi:hypothetical protein